MGLYIRKSVSVGPFRFNFSKSGVGVSAGVKGLRVGTGPRGNYITVGRGGLYYRATLPASSPSSQSTSPVQHVPTASPPQYGVGQMVPIQSGPVTAMSDTSSADLLTELNAKAKRPNYWIWTAGAGIAALWLLPATLPGWVTPSAAVLLTGLTAYLGLRDTVAKTAVLCYELAPENEEAYESLHEAFKSLGSCHKAWRIDAQAAVHDRKYHAGAGSVVKRKSAQFGKGLPPYVKSNIEVPYVKAGAISLYFMPDRVLVYSGSNVGAVPYKDLQVDGAPRQFIEDQAVPGDAEIVRRTWKFVNKNGGPDRRFKNNRELPVALYEEISFRSPTGLNELFQLSKHSLTNTVRQQILRMTSVLPN